MESRSGKQENGFVTIKLGSTGKLSRPKKGDSLLTAVENFVAIDIETTGLSPDCDEIIELGAVRYRSGEATDSFSQLVKPETPVDDFITRLTGISNEMLADALPIEQALPEFLAFLGSDILVGHNVNFDINFLYDACKRLELPALSNDFVDTMRIAKRMYKELEHHTLDDILKHLGLERRTLHRGLDDCELTAACYLEMCRDERFDEATKRRLSRQFTAKNVTAVDGMENIDSPLYGKVCVFTGVLESFTRKEAAQIVVNTGGTVSDSVTKKTNFLILGNNDYCKAIKNGKSNKQKVAEKLMEEGADISIIPESVFLDILQMGSEKETIEETSADVETANSDAGAMEREAFDCIVPILREQLLADNLSADYLLFKQKADSAQYSSVYLFNENNLFCRICFRGKQNYIAVSSKYEKLIPADAVYKTQSSDGGYCRIAISAPGEIKDHMELLRQILESQINTYPSDFSCCSRYEACSDAKRCIHPDSDMALRCSYRKNLKLGRVFYGKNSTI